ncbi:MAG TPA: tetratricopeptide repeat protein [Usitatibacter sp.]|nr:tetratricopeptide repeat protein [Usitatibacter sp.]
MASSPEAFQAAMEVFRRGSPGDAVARFDQVLASQPGHVAAQHFKGYALCQLGRFDEGLPLLERSLAAEPRNPTFNANLGTIRYVMGDIPAAIAVLERTVRIAPTMPEPYANLALALRESGDFDRALVAARRAVQLRPAFPAARINLAMCLLSLSRWKEAWEAYPWRPDPRANLRDMGLAMTVAHATTLPAPLQGAELTLHGDQGLGDVLFFIRFAAALRERGARLRFWGDERIGAILVRNGHVESATPATAPAPAGPDSHRLWLAELPSLLGAAESFPAPVRLVPLPGRVQAWREKLAASGPGPYTAITWRAGLPRSGKAVLSKAVDPAALGAALHACPGSVVSVQRDPAPAEAAAFAAALGKPVADLGAANADLEDMLALMDAVDEYVCVSNTNLHLRAGLAKAARVLVPWPPEWRWTRDSPRSPWFPEFPLYRARGDATWDEALARLAADLAPGAP